MATSYPTISVPAGWTDIAAEEPGIASAAGVMVQNRGRQTIAVFFGGASAPTEEDDGEILGRFKRHFDKSGSAHIWVKGPGHVAVVVDDVNPIPVGGTAFDPLATIAEQTTQSATELAELLDSFNTAEPYIPHEQPYAVSEEIPYHFDLTTSGDHAIVAADATGKTHRVHRLIITCNDDVKVLLKGNTDTGDMPFQFGAGIDLARAGDPYYTTDADTALTINLSGNVGVSGTAWVKTA